MTLPANIRLTLDPLDDLLARRHPRNPKGHDLDALAASFDRFGYVMPGAVNDRTGSVIAGHGRNDALARRRAAGLPPPRGIGVDDSGRWLVPTIHGFDLNEDDALAYLLADNRITELGGYDEAALAAVLRDLEATTEGLNGTGFSELDLDKLLRGLEVAPAPPPVDPDESPELPRRPNTYVHPGDLYALGEHRVLVADSRDEATFAALLDPGEADILLTDPPYGVSYRGGPGGRLTIENDDPGGLSELLARSFAAIDPALAPGAALYMFHPAGPLSLTFTSTFVGQGWQFRQQLIWLKDSLVLGHSDYMYRHEPILYGYKPGGGRRGRGATGWYGGNDCSSVLEVPRPRVSAQHPTAKPIALLAQILRVSSRRGDTVLDPFLGSGSTLIAADRLGRRCLGVEVDPAYAQVAIERWQKLTGNRAVHLRATAW
ncbi:MAG: DNA modification methylase [Chloroflexi bacterium]|nr:DNA modification methylase [Chloroflexota bacterium]